ncbi:lysozyme inhibitor LprI family protein [Methylopila henanensis]|uniref:Lysozyme inhibitor LprI family protein n=1 Tax=Methylopila henanensis TaxID=873516 RepID=A0ABW4K8H4_9HYPH
MRFSGAILAVVLGATAMAFVSYAIADECSNADSQAKLNECYGNAFKKTDSELNKLYKEIERRLSDDPDTKKSLVVAQRAWVAFRDAECNLQASGGGSAAGMTYPICLSRLTENRIQDFKNYLKCEEGDTSCPIPPAN